MSQISKPAENTPTPEIETLTGNSGGAIGPDGSFNVNIVGSGGIIVTGTPASHTLTITGGGLTWTDVTSGSQQIAVNNGYTADYGSLVTFTLPATAAYGTIFTIVGKGAGGWTIVENSGQNMIFGNTTSSTTNGSLSSQLQYDVVTLLCTVVNTTFTVISSIGNLTVA